MAIPLLKDVPLAPPDDLGRYRREDYEVLPDQPRCELIYGRFYLSPSPSLLHQVLVGLLFEKLRRAARKAGGWAFVAPLDVYLTDHSAEYRSQTFPEIRLNLIELWQEVAEQLPNG